MTSYNSGHSSSNTGGDIAGTFCTDVAIIGGGPVGMFAVFQAGMLGFKSCVIDILGEAGGQCSALYPEKPIYDIPGFAKVTGQQLVDNISEQIKPFNPHYFLNSRVTSIERISGDDNGYNFDVRISGNSGNLVRCKAVIIATGGGAFLPNKPPISNIDTFENSSVFYSVKSVDALKGKRVVIAGGGDSAVDWALNLAGVAEKIYLVHRRNKFRSAVASIEKVRKIAETSGDIEFVIPYQLSALEGDGGVLKSVEVADIDGNRKILPADVLLAFFGLSMNNSDLLNWNIGLHKDLKHVDVDVFTMSTSEDGIYAIGDIAWYRNKQKLILTGFSEAALACNSIYKFIYPDKELHFEYSTTKGVKSIQ